MSRRVDIAGVAAFRVLFGLVLTIALLRFMSKGWIARFFTEPAFHFTYPGFGFVRPWPGAGMYVHYVFLLVCALGITAGFKYRFCIVGFFLGFTYVELLEKAVYLNHYYLVSLLSGLLALLPAERAFSIDVRLRPTLARATVPAWVPLVLRVQVGLVYFFAGVAKLNHDWLLEAQPLRIWLSTKTDWPVVGALLAEPAVAYLASWFGALFDLTIVGFLYAKGTRVAAFAVAAGFHALTGLLFPIGIFPWLMTVSATVFFAPDWPRRLFAGRARPAASEPSAWTPPRWLALVLLVHSVVQIAVPLSRHLERDSAWTLRGFNFAWKVMVAEKAGNVRFRARDRRSGEVSFVDPRGFLAPFQELSMAQDPEMVRQAALYVRDRLRAQGRDVAVYADALASLNGRPARRLIDPTVDLTGPVPASWILPLE